MPIDDKRIGMHYREGKLDGIEFAPEETPMEDLKA